MHNIKTENKCLKKNVQMIEEDETLMYTRHCGHYFASLKKFKSNGHTEVVLSSDSPGVHSFVMRGTNNH